MTANARQDRPWLLRADEIAAERGDFSHPWNPASLINGTSLSRLAGMQRAMVSLGTIPPGKESFVYHAHHYEEEWVYILSGRGVALIDGKEYEVGAGDFMGFPTPSVAHHLRNPFDDPLHYLMGGETLPHEVADFPLLGKRKVSLHGQTTAYDLPAAPADGN